MILLSEDDLRLTVAAKVLAAYREIKAEEAVIVMTARQSGWSHDAIRRHMGMGWRTVGKLLEYPAGPNIPDIGRLESLRLMKGYAQIVGWRDRAVCTARVEGMAVSEISRISGISTSSLWRITKKVRGLDAA